MQYLCKKNKKEGEEERAKKVGGMQWRHKKRRKNCRVREKIERKKDGGGGMNSNKKAKWGGVERWHQLSEDEKQTPKMTEVQSRVQKSVFRITKKR